MWIRANGAFEAIVAPLVFEAARAIIQQRSLRFSDEELLGALKRLLEERGCLSGLIIDETENFPSSSAYRSRFGSLRRAYQLIGYTPSRDYRYVEINRVLRLMHPDIVTRTIATIESLGGTVQRDPATDMLSINGEFTASIVIVRCLETTAGSKRWKIRFDTGLHPDITVAVRMAPGNRQIFDYYLLPRVELASSDLRLKEDNGIYWDTYRFETLDRFFDLTARASIRSAA